MVALRVGMDTYLLSLSDSLSLCEHCLTILLFHFTHPSLSGYLPFDKTGDWLYHAVEIISLCASGLLLFAFFGPLKSTYEDKFDRFGNLPPVPAQYGAAYLLGPALILAIFFHPNLNKEFFSDTCWTLSMYIEAVAMLPQIYMFQKQAAEENGLVEAMIGHTTFALGFSRVFELIFWVGSFKELANEAGGKAPGYIVLLSQLAHLVIMADFFYYYFISISKGAPMELPQSYHNTNV
jgi:ER lumen protein retaining receptor